ncbi:hypothetical protein VPNG_01676 [Cytospora leucostoma]|uniref:Glycosyltransferase 2 n=1 Tax=Cytospora leucostoma TaxID=1230097 RepID=A0A423XJK8_9PEZI|nr:hypothetical protein VPNG_01676 [Cytospora leucostoma]
MRPSADTELGVTKKNDDLWYKGTRRPGPRPGSSSHGWKSATRLPPRKTFKRIGLLLLAITAIYLFIHNIPTDLGPAKTGRPFYTHPNPNAPPGGVPRPNSANAVGDLDKEKDLTATRRDYNGPVRFLYLGETLHAIAGTKGTSPVNKNVLFAASSLQSAASLLPLACQMGRELRSYVHFALMSRSEISIEELQEVNGVDDSCQIIFHDARAEHLGAAVDETFKQSVARALYHIDHYMHPQAIIVDSSELEEPLFLSSLRRQAKDMNLASPIIELPEHAEARLAWITKLDAKSLAQWDLINVDIVVHAHAGASGSLIRLLKSLSVADYTACTVPHLTIELPEKIDPPTSQFLQNFQWPPRSASSLKSANRLTLRHRILGRGDSEEESSVRFLESFWPANPVFSHALVLSPQVELAPEYFHYLKMSVLEYRYSTRALHQAWDQRLFSISLDLPTTNLDASQPFVPPSRLPDRLDDLEIDSAPPDAPSPFLWQAPNSNAALFLGEKWAELHGFVSQVLEAQHGLESTPSVLAEKAVSRDYPAWMEHALRLCRARGYWTLYPSKDLAANLATVHGELYQQPEEYESDGRGAEHEDGDEVRLRHESLLDALPGGEVLRFAQMPLLSWDDKLITLDALNEATLKYAAEFRRTVGGCTETPAAAPEPSAQDLFCSGDDGI